MQCIYCCLMRLSYYYFLAYYIHTSGSTGKPKCVVHCHSSLDWHSHVTLIGSGLTRVDDTCLQVADCSFDLHIRDIFCFLSTGANVVTIPQGNCSIKTTISSCIHVCHSCPFRHASPVQGVPHVTLASKRTFCCVSIVVGIESHGLSAYRSSSQLAWSTWRPVAHVGCKTLASK